MAKDYKFQVGNKSVTFIQAKATRFMPKYKVKFTTDNNDVFDFTSAFTLVTAVSMALDFFNIQSLKNVDSDLIVLQQHRVKGFKK